MAVDNLDKLSRLSISVSTLDSVDEVMTLELSVESVLAIMDDCAILMERREVLVEVVRLVIDTEDAVGIDRDTL